MGYDDLRGLEPKAYTYTDANGVAHCKMLGPYETDGLVNIALCQRLALYETRVPEMLQELDELREIGKRVAEMEPMIELLKKQIVPLTQERDELRARCEAMAENLEALTSCLVCKHGNENGTHCELPGAECVFERRGPQQKGDGE